MNNVICTFHCLLKSAVNMLLILFAVIKSSLSNHSDANQLIKQKTENGI